MRQVYIYLWLQTDIFKASLSYELPIPWEESNEYGSGDISQRIDSLWEAIDFDPGMVALDSKYVTKMGLPQSMPFPWDTDKQLYLLDGYHNLHCVVCHLHHLLNFIIHAHTHQKIIHHHVIELTLGETTTYPYEHIAHCIDNLRQDTLCQADDTPRRFDYEGIKPDQERNCRDWSKLETWALEHNSCYRYLNYSVHLDDDKLKRFYYCPPGSPYASLVEEHLEAKRD